MNQHNNLNTLSSLYLYGNKINLWILQGGFAQADTMLAEVWQSIGDTDLLRYSKYEYFQIILQLRNYDAIVHIALDQCDMALTSLQIAEGLVQNTSATEFKVSTRLSRLYFELVCKQDEAAARQEEQKAIETSGGKLPFNVMLGIASYMHHNHQSAWAKQYARLVLEAAASDQTIPAAAITRAESILKAVA